MSAEAAAPQAHVVWAAGTRRRLLLAPVTVSPTKPLTPTHLKYLLSLDMLYRATATFADVTLLYHHGTFAGCQQIAGFWAYLDRCHPGCEAATEEAIGGFYAAYHRAGRPAYAIIEPVVRRAEEGWIHPVSVRLLDLWESHYRRLGMFDPQLGRGRPGLAATDEIIDLLRRKNLCVDGRSLGAPVYLDATAAGLPLRPVLSADGQSNYLLYLLRELIPKLEGYDQVVLAHDTELRADYQTVAHVLSALDASVTRFEVPRVPVDGVVKSARFGGWQGHTLDDFAGPVIEEFGLAAFRLGLRLYLIAGLGRTARQSFSTRYLRRWARRAVRLLTQPMVPADHAVSGRYLAGLSGRRGFADPYRLATTLMSCDAAVPVAGLLQVVLGRNGADQDGERSAVAADDPVALDDAAGLSFSSTVDRTLIHRRNLAEVFLTDARRTGARSFVAAALLPIVHPHYTSHEGLAGQITDPMLLLECCRQAETYAAHAFHEVDPRAAFILRSWSAELAVDAAGGGTGPAELVMTAVTGNPRWIAGALRSLDYEFGLWVSGTRIGRVRMDVSYAAREAYLAVRSRGRAGPPPASDRQPPVATGRPVTPSRVGRINATDTLLLEVATGPDTVTATLRVPAENPSLFDHAHDHVPAMVLTEAARQIAALATKEWGGKPPHRTAMVAMESSFTAYAELDRIVTMTAKPGLAAGSGRRTVAVTFHQDGKEISQANLVIAAISDLTPPRRRPVPGGRAAVIAGLGSYVPPTVISNDQLASYLDVDDEWIRRRTGIRERHVITPGQATSDLAVEAGRRAMESAGIADVGAVILATSTPDRPVPATAPEVASRLGLGDIPAFDVAAVCAGFLYVLASGAGLIAAGTVDSVLAIGADTFSTITDPADPPTRAIFGDGAGAVLLRAGSTGEHGALDGLSLGSDGSLSELIIVPGGGSRQRSAGSPAKPQDTYLLMQGRAVFAQAVRRMSASVRETAAKMGWPLEEVDWFVLHQANARILAAIAERIGVPTGRFLSNIDRVGNTVAASIPLALADGVASGALAPGQRVVLAGFGGGLTWGSAAFIWPQVSPG